MPVYVYRCDDGSTFEIEQRMTADALLICPTTGQTVVRVLQPFSPRYTGTGFYSTDHRKHMREDSASGSAPGGTAQSPVRLAGGASASSDSSSVKVQSARGSHPSSVARTQ
jgi:putative FmdB family regulatory protein